ncbi:MAG: small basic family protein [Fimbriimonadaceae bacterium]|nr:small basic family protein [Fimbriimonadaceae bacterium]QYK55277.1 MAG: small basic family protein [Fimbriimonadaceae bacterium]
MILIPLLALAIGVALGFLARGTISPGFGVYLGVAVIAGVDSVFGGTRSVLEGKFHTDVFASGFFANIIIAFFLAWFGDRVGVDLYFAAVLVMGWRIFTNLSLIRRYLLTRYHDYREQKRQQSEHNRQRAEGESASSSLAS